MRIFLDSADLGEIREVSSLGFLQGVTTNPTLVAKTGADYHCLIADICKEVDGPVSAEVLSRDFDRMLVEARELAAIAPQVVVKIPITRDGLRAISILKREGIATNATLAFSLPQSLLAARAGAAYVSPFVGRMDDNGNDGLRLLEEIIGAFGHYDLDTEIIAASIRHPQHVVAAARLGCHIATIPYQVIMQMIDHPMTAAGLAKFERDWQMAWSKSKHNPGGNC